MVLIVSPPDARYAPLGRPAYEAPQEVSVLVLPVLRAYQAELQTTQVRLRDQAAHCCICPAHRLCSGLRSAQLERFNAAKRLHSEIPDYVHSAIALSSLPSSSTAASAWRGSVLSVTTCSR